MRQTNQGPGGSIATVLGGGLHASLGGSPLEAEGDAPVCRVAVERRGHDAHEVLYADRRSASAAYDSPRRASPGIAGHGLAAGRRARRLWRRVSALVPLGGNAARPAFLAALRGQSLGGRHSCA